MFQSFSRFFMWLFADFKAKWRGFLLRFAPLWLPLVLIWVLPPCREIAISNDLIGKVNFIGLLPSHTYSSSVFRHARDEPDNLGAQLNAIPWSYTSQQEFYVYEEEVPPSRTEWLQHIAGHFHEQWLPAYLIRCRMDTTSYAAPPLSNNPTPSSAAMFEERSKSNLPLLRTIERGMKAEPQNAFWVVGRAWWEWNFAPRPFHQPSKSNLAPVPGYPFPPPVGASTVLAPVATPNNESVVHKTLEILRYAHDCTYYDDGSTQAHHLMRRDRLSQSGTCLETDWLEDDLGLPRDNGFLQELFMELQAMNSATSIVRVPRAPVGPAESPTTRLSPQVLVASGAAMAHIGNLMDAVPQKARGYRPTLEWCRVGWNIDKTSAAMGRRAVPLATASSRFARWARSVGQSKYADQTMQIAAQVTARQVFWKRASTRSLLVPKLSQSSQLIRADALVSPIAVWSASLCEGLSACAIVLGILWMSLNVVLARSEGAPSSHFKRWGLASVLVSTLLVLSIWSLRGAGTTEIMARTGMVPILVGVIFALVVSSALLCSITTIGRHHHELINRDDDKWHTKLIPALVLPWVEPVLIGVSAFMVLLFGFLFFYFALSPKNGTPLIRGGLGFGGIRTMPDLMAALELYSLTSVVWAVAMWLCNWRWPRKSVRSITHSGLRWWKETIGASVCLLVWLYLFVALAAWPSRNSAKRMIEERWQMGDWAWLQKNL